MRFRQRDVIPKLLLLADGDALNFLEARTDLESFMQTRHTQCKNLAVSRGIINFSNRVK